jgi:ribonuclease D
MASEKLPPPTWVATSLALQQMIGELASQSRLAVDTESNSLHAYREQVCLIQFSTLQSDFLVDPLALDDVTPLAPLFADPKIEKVFHAVEYDLVCLRRDFGITVVNVFDTMQAARILGYKQVGLDAMLALKLGVRVDKRYQKADWARRPLTLEQLNYARLDTHYLLQLREILQRELESRDRWALAREEFVRLSHGGGMARVELPPWLRIGGAQKFNEQQLAVLQELCAWREEQAQRMNRPMFKVMDDKRLVAVAEAAPMTMEELESLELTSRQIHLFGQDLIRAVTYGRQASPVKRPRSPRPNEAYLKRLDALSEWRKRAAEKIGVESDIVLPKAFMHAIADKNPRSLEELAKLMPESPWRLGEYGPELLGLLSAAPGQRGQEKQQIKK